MPESCSLKLRKILDAPLKRKPVWFKCFFPFFFFISFFIFLIAKGRRKASFASASQRSSLTDSIKIICVGNVLIGGTGKSPIVQKLAEEFLKKGWIVAIAARGISNNKKPVYFNSQGKNLDLLSDENREHYEILKSKNLIQNLFILQNKNRNDSLSYFKEELTKITYTYAVFILDDGLQHFSCPRDINLCVWQPDFLINSPNFAMPVGPYREGFGMSSFQALLQTFDFRIWSRTPEENFSIFTEKIKNSLEKYKLKPSKNDIVACFKLNIIKISLQNNEYIFTKAHKNEFLDISSLGVLAGIAHPRAFLSDLKNVYINCENWAALLLDDHAEYNKFSPQILEFINNHPVCIFTFKDFFRWCDQEDFKKSLSSKLIFGCTIELEFYDMKKNQIHLSELLNV